MATAASRASTTTRKPSGPFAQLTRAVQALQTVGSDRARAAYDSLKPKAAADLERILSKDEEDLAKVGSMLLKLCRKHEVSWTQAHYDKIKAVKSSKGDAKRGSPSSDMVVALDQDKFDVPVTEQPRQKDGQGSISLVAIEAIKMWLDKPSADVPMALAVLAPVSEAPEECRSLGKDVMVPVVIQKGGTTYSSHMPGAIYQLSLVGSIWPNEPAVQVVDISKKLADIVPIQVAIFERYCDPAFKSLFQEQFEIIKQDK